jgi:hypothetical protein
LSGLVSEAGRYRAQGINAGRLVDCPLGTHSAEARTEGRGRRLVVYSSNSSRVLSAKESHVSQMAGRIDYLIGIGFG